MAIAESRRPVAADEIQVENPATGAVVGSVPNMPPDEVGALVARARAAQPAWEALGFEGRAEVLRRAQKWVTDNQDRIVETIVSETGQDPRRRADQRGRLRAPRAFGFWAKHAAGYLADEKVRTSSPFVLGRKLVVRYRPLGVIGVIGPWNYPLTNSFGDCIPALAAGNAVILKPSEVTPLTSLLMAEALRECGLPEDVFLVATGDGATGAALVDDVDMVMFTGSTATGKKIMARAAETLTPVSLELGGKDPMIVLADADLERATDAATYYSMQNAGQTCISVERVYVEAPIYDEFVDKLTAQGRRAAPGRLERPGHGRRRRGHLPAAARHRAAARRGGPRGRRARAHRRPGAHGRRPLLRADRARRRRPLDGVHDRGDVRPDGADDEGRRRRGGRAARQRLAVRARGVRVDEGRGARRGDRAADRVRRRVRQRRPAQLPRAGAADGRLEGVGPRHPARRRRHPQVLPPAVAAGHALRRRPSGTCSSTPSGRGRRS